MALRLRVTGRLADRLGERAVRVFGVHGGRVGRASDNDWVLPDPERFLSGHHATIEYRAGAWQLVDTSSNGTFVNGANEALGRDRAHALRDGDRLRMGDYDVLVSITPDTDFPTHELSATALDEAAAAEYSVATHGDLGAEFDVKHLIANPTPPPDEPPDEPPPLRVSDAYGQAVTVTPGRDAPRPAVRAQAGPRPGTAMGHSSPIQSFCRGAGLDPATLSPEQVSAALALAGQLVREMALGLMTSLQHRVEQKSRYGVADTVISPAGINPFKMSTSIDELITRLFAPRSNRFLMPLEAVRASFADIRRHEQATTVAMQDALAEYLRRFAPEQLEQQFDQGLARSQPSGAGDPQKYWGLYTEFYRVLAQASAEGLPHAFAEEFARAYETASEELRESAPRSGGNRSARGS
jgi:predicted component of type VI protein secretion system